MRPHLKLPATCLLVALASNGCVTVRAAAPHTSPPAAQPEDTAGTERAGVPLAAASAPPPVRTTGGATDADVPTATPAPPTGDVAAPPTDSPDGAQPAAGSPRRRTTRTGAAPGYGGYPNHGPRGAVPGQAAYLCGQAGKAGVATGTVDACRKMFG